nr:hypothetical protein [Tanacetum cinerariifolium]
MDQGNLEHRYKLRYESDNELKRTFSSLCRALFVNYVSNRKSVSQPHLPTGNMQGRFLSKNVKSCLMDSPDVPETSICPNSQKTNVDTPELGSTLRPKIE